MSTLTNETDLLRCFREIDRSDVELPPHLAFPLSIERVLAWAIGPRAFLLFRPGPDLPLRGIVFHRSFGAMPDMAAMCEWCHAVRAHGAVKLLSVRADERRRLGIYVCSDLSCVARSREPPGPDDLADGLDAHERAERSLRRIAEFASRRLF
jgi:hypothetical protein